MNEQTRKARELDALQLIAAELENLRVLEEHELGVKLEYDVDAGGPYEPETDTYECCPSNRVERYIGDQLRRRRQGGRNPCHQDAKGRRRCVGEGPERPDRGRQHYGLQGQCRGDLPARGVGPSSARPGQGSTGSRPFRTSCLRCAVRHMLGPWWVPYPVLEEGVSPPPRTRLGSSLRPRCTPILPAARPFAASICRGPGAPT